MRYDDFSAEALVRRIGDMAEDRIAQACKDVVPMSDERQARYAMDLMNNGVIERFSQPIRDELRAGCLEVMRAALGIKKAEPDAVPE